jgi:hypothetical protein
MKCVHCCYENNNFLFCGGCGRPLLKKAGEKFSKLPEESTKFLDEVINTIERSFYSEEIVQNTLDVKTNIINISDISKESGILIIDRYQWKETEKRTKIASFYSELVLSYFLSSIMTGVVFFTGLSGIEITIKLFVVCFFLVSFLQWFIIPFIAGSTVIAFSNYNCGLFADLNKSVRGKSSTLFILFIFMSLYLFIPFTIIDLVLTRYIKSYIPAALKIAGVDYLEKTGGEK